MQLHHNEAIQIFYYNNLLIPHGTNIQGSSMNKSLLFSLVILFILQCVSSSQSKLPTPGFRNFKGWHLTAAEEMSPEVGGKAAGMCDSFGAQWLIAPTWGKEGKKNVFHGTTSPREVAALFSRRQASSQEWERVPVIKTEMEMEMPPHH